jgi:hypothetical protein
MDLDLVGQQSGALVAFVLPVSIKDRSLHVPWSSHRFIVPSIYLLMGAERLVSLLSLVPALFGPTFRVVIYIGLKKSKHHTEAQPTVLGA